MSPAPLPEGVGEELLFVVAPPALRSARKAEMLRCSADREDFRSSEVPCLFGSAARPHSVN